MLRAGQHDPIHCSHDDGNCPVGGQGDTFRAPKSRSASHPVSISKDTARERGHDAGGKRDAAAGYVAEVGLPVWEFVRKVALVLGLHPPIEPLTTNANIAAESMATPFG